MIVRALADRRVEALQRPDVLVVQVDVHERRDVAAVQDLGTEARVAGREVLEHLAHRPAGGLDLSLAADFRPKGGRDSDLRHQDATCAAPPLQNST